MNFSQASRRIIRLFSSNTTTVISSNNKIIVNGKKIDPASDEGKHITKTVDEEMKKMNTTFSHMDKAFEKMETIFSRL